MDAKPNSEEEAENIDPVESNSLPSIEDDEGDKEEPGVVTRNFLQIPYGFQSRGSYKHASKNCEIAGVTYNSRFRQFVFLDSRGITSWSFESVYSTVTRHLNYPSYQFNVLRLITFSRKFNVYFALSKEYALKVFNLNFHEVFSVAAEMHSVLCMVFNHGRDELITGGTGGMKFWTFGEIVKDRQKAWEKDSRPMANYGLVLRASYPDMAGSWVKHVELDDAMQRLYCLSERNVVAYDMEGNLLFEILDAHRGPVTGCVYSKASNFLVTVGNDCDVNVWSRSKNGGKVHTFTGHSKAIIKIILHPESSALVITAAMDGIVKVHSLDIMEEIYSLPVFSEGIYWMDTVSTKLIYCCSNRVIEVFSLNHLTNFWALTRCSVTSLSLVTCSGKSTRVMVVGNDSSVRLLSRKRQNLSTVLPPPSISPLNMVKDVAYSRDFNIMYLLINEEEIWVYYTRTNPATRVESWSLDYIEDIHDQHSQDASLGSRTSSRWPVDGYRSPSPFVGNSLSPDPRSLSSRDASVRESLRMRRERVQLLCLGMLYSPVILHSAEGEACPDATEFLVAGTQDGRVLFLHMFCKGLMFHQIQANKDAVLGLYHDQSTNTLVTKCRHPGIAVLIWSLPYLELLMRVDCEADLTCFTRMNNLLLCGHNSGYLHLHSLDQEKCSECHQTEVTPAVPKDHQDRVNSVDANFTLKVFCSASRDGVVKMWDKEKTLLCEITMDETLTVAAFLNSQGDILVGFKQHIFVISRSKVYPMKELVPNTDVADLVNDEAFETESDIYEDPSVRYESKKILQPDPANMENYLVPFPNLQLKTSWFMEGRPPPDLEQQNRQDENESLSLLSDNLSLAPTEVYCSPSTTPRSLSLASFEPLSERKGRTELWEMPECGNSPVSSPPQTPSPEPSPPSTPPPGEESEDEESEGGANALEEGQQENGPSHVEFVDPAKKDAKKKTFVSSFRREGGRLGNITIDSKSLRMRSGDGGPGYAAPVSRRAAVQNPEPKPFKPRRIPRAVVKKFKKPKEKGEEDTEKETGQEQGKKLEAEEELPKKEEDDDDATQEREVIDPSSLAANRINLPSGPQKPLIRQDTGSTRHIVGASLVTQGQDSAHSTETEERTPRKDARGMQEMKTPHKTGIPSEVRKAEGPAVANSRFADSGIETFTTGQIEGSKNPREGTQEAAKQVLEQAKAVGGSSLDPSVPLLVTYIDQDTGEIVQKPANEIPEGAEILDDYNDEDDLPGGDENQPCLSSVGHVSKREHGGRDVTFAEDVKKPNFRVSPRHNKNLPDFYYNSVRNSPSSRPFSLGAAPKDAVFPVYPFTRPGDLRRTGSENDPSVSPLTIFALARNRKRNAVKAGKAQNHSAKYSDRDSNQKPEASDISSSRIDGKDFDDLDLNGEELARLIDKMGSPALENERTVAESLRPPRIRKQESTLMRWCIRALQKRDRNVMFPPKPSRPNSSPSSSSSKPAKQGGNTLYLNVTQSKPRPKTAETIRSTDTGQEEYSLFPYKSTPVLDEVSTRQRPRDQRTPAGLKVNTRIHESRDEDDDLMDAYRAMRSSIGLHVESDEDFMKAIPPGENESSTDLPVLETNDYSGQWQSKVLERARVLKQRRLERQKTATERRRVLETEQKERWKNSSHFECAQESPTKSETAIEFVTSPPPSPVRTATPIPSQEQTHIRNLKDQELTSDRPYRLRMNPQSPGACLTPVAKSLLNLKSSDHQVSEIAHVLPKPAPSASIPSKCSRYMLVPQQVPKQDQPVASSTMEETLLLLRFPKSRVRRRHRDGTAIYRPHSNPNVHLETGFEF